MAALQASRNAHPPQADCAFESACALPSGVIRGYETTSMLFCAIRYAMKSPFAPFAKGGWGDVDAETSVERNAGGQPFSRENGEVISRCRPLTGNGK